MESLEKWLFGFGFGFGFGMALDLINMIERARPGF